MANHSILTVDDSISIRNMIKYTLENEGMMVAEAIDGADALEKLSLLRPNLIIADINMPKMNGIELIKEIKKDDQLSSIPIIVLTTETEHKLRDQARMLGAIGWLVKPFKPIQLIGIVKRFMM